MFAQVHSRSLNIIYSFEAHTPFDSWDVWRDIRRLPLEEQRISFSDPDLREKLIAEASNVSSRHKRSGLTIMPPDWDWVFHMTDATQRGVSLADIAKGRGVPPAEAFIDIALETNFKALFRSPINNHDDADVIEMMKHPRSVVTFSDSGAHVSQIMDSPLQTNIFSQWVREEQALSLEEAVRYVTFDTASQWGLHDRGLLRIGMAGDLAIFDPDSFAPNLPEVVNDLPAGATRLKQTARGLLATVVNGEILLRDNEHTGAASGELLRGPLAR